MFKGITAHILNEGCTTWCGHPNLMQGGYLCITPCFARGRFNNFIAECKAQNIEPRLHDFTAKHTCCFGCFAEMLLSDAKVTSAGRGDSEESPIAP